MKVLIGDGEYAREENTESREVPWGGKHREFIGETEFDGHYVLWGFEYFPTTYLKSSGLSGDEYRKGGEIRYFRNRKQVFTEFCREPHIAVLLIGKTLLNLQENVPWDKLKVGEKVWYERTPAVIDMVLEEQGCVVLKTEDGSNFPNPVWYKEDDGYGEREKTVKVEITDPHLYWYRT